MHDLMENVLSPLIQIIFVIAILAMMADARPETIVKLVLDAVVSIIEAAFKSTAKILEVIYNILKFFFGKKGTGTGTGTGSGSGSGSGSGKTPRKPGPKRKPKPAPDIKLVEVEILPPQ